MSKITFLTQLAPSTNGIALIDKPSGISSHAVVNQVRRITGIKRVGHCGTLDPLASGLLIILIGRQFTKLQSQFLKQDKTYLCTAQLGIETDTYDTEGRILQQAQWPQLEKISQNNLKTTLKSFQGELKQTVPAFSAVKVKGKKLYQLARKKTAEGECVSNTQLPSRKVEILKLEMTDFRKNTKKQTLEFDLNIHCSSGTYIRSLVHDIGQKIGVGATMTALKRTKIGKFDLEDSMELEKP